METLAIFSYVIFKLYFCKKEHSIPCMAPVNKGSDKHKHKSLSISEKVELLKKLDKVVNVGYAQKS